MISELKNQGIKVDDVFVCPHHWNESCDCRKPEAGLFFETSKKHMLRMDKTVYIGDDVRDVEAAYNAGCGSVLISSKDNNIIVNKPKWSIKVNKLSEAIIEIEKYIARA